MEHRDQIQGIYGTQGSDTGNRGHGDQIQGIYGTQGSDTGDIWNTVIRYRGYMEHAGIRYGKYKEHRGQIQGYMEHRNEIQGI